MHETDALSMIRASMIILQLEADILLSAEILEEAAEKFGKKLIEKLLFELSVPGISTDADLVHAKAEIALVGMRPRMQGKERN